jgi:uncharacterized protein YqeY
MTLKSQIDQDLKTAMLAGDKPLVSVLRGIKSTILNAEISTSSRQEGLSDAEVVALLQKESKKELKPQNYMKRMIVKIAQATSAMSSK